MFARVSAAASLAVRHAGAYGELIGEDLGLAYAAFQRRLWAGIVLTSASVFSTALACLWLITLAWDTPGRMWLIAGLCILFLLVSAVALAVLKAPGNNPGGLLARTSLEWQKDRLLLDELLARPGAKPE